jgi:rhodanese-related sulfurtransferase
MYTQAYFRRPLVFTVRSAMMATMCMLVACVAPGGSQGGSQPVSSAAVRYLEPGEVRILQLKGEAFLLHVGNDLEYDQRRIEGAALRRVDDLESLTVMPITPSQVVLYSAGFGDLYSDRVQPVLRKLGDRVAVLRGGMAAWERSGFPVEGRKDNNVKISCQPVTAPELRRGFFNHDEATLIDVRQKQDFETAHIPGARSVMPHELDKHIKSLPKDRWIIFYDQVGGGGAMMSEQFAHQGFRYCGYLAGGYQAWLSPRETGTR